MAKVVSATTDGAHVLGPVLQRMLEQLPFLVCWVGGDQRYRFANRAYARWFNRGVEDIVGAQVADVLGEDTYSRVAVHIEQALSGKVAEFEVTVGQPDGGGKTMQVTCTPNLGDTGGVDGFFVFAEDTTERRLNEAALEQSRLKFALLFERMLDGCAIHDIICDDDGKPVDYQFVDVNPAFERLTGLQRRDVIGKTVRELLPETEAVWIEQYGRVALTGEAVQFEAFSQELARHFEVSAFSTERGTFAATFKDVTAGRAAEDGRKELQRIIERSPAVTFLWRSEEAWPVEFVSNNITLFGYTPDDFISGRVKFADIVHPDDLPRVTEEVKKYSAEQAEEFEQEYRLKTASGAFIWIDDHTWIRRRADGSISHFQGILLDVSEKKEFEERLRLAKVEAEEANRAKSAFLAAMSHDLRTPLNAIIGFSEMMRARTFGALGDAHYDEYAKDIHRSGQLLVSLINDILDLSKIEAHKYAISDDVIDVSAVVGECVLQSRAASDKKGQVISVDVSASLPALKADERAVMQILNNLVSNAIKFSPDDGRISITAKLGPDNRISVAVTDNGIGMSRKDLAMISEPFAQADGLHARRHEGTGLGLYLVDSLMKLHGGTMSVESTVGQGTTVTVMFPAERTSAVE